MADSSPLMIWVVDETGDIQFVNSTYRDFFKISKEQIKGLDYRLLIHPDDRDAFWGFSSIRSGKEVLPRDRKGAARRRQLEMDRVAREHEVFAGRKVPRSCSRQLGYHRAERGGGKSEKISGSSGRAREGAHRCASGENRKLAHEIAERRKAEAQLVQAQKIEALGRFAGGIAHDLNNMLYPIIIEAESLLEEMPPGTPWHQTVNQILSAATRQRDLVKQILSFSRRGDRRFTPIQLGP